MDSDDENYDIYFDEEEDDPTIDESQHSNKEKNYKILKDFDIRQLVNENISKASTILSVPRDIALALLRHYSWDIDRAHEEWFAMEKEVRKSIGILFEYDNNNSVSVSKKLNEVVPCGICFEEYCVDDDNVIAFATCNTHPYCKVCWECYLRTWIHDGGPNKCLVLRCPDPSCEAMVGESMIVEFSLEKDVLKYYDYLYRSYVEENKNMKWCPFPGCEYAVEFEMGSENYDVICDCCNVFCWNCLEEIHRPIDCDMIDKWKNMNRQESATTEWILAFTKKCPKCKNPIEKNMGCMHMTCRCGHEFCWLCFGNWGTCLSTCNRYQEKKEVTQAKQNIQRYTHFYERWVSNGKSKDKAFHDLNELKEEGLKKFSDDHGINELELQFIIDAWEQIVQCRRVLTWTYVYGFYLPREEVAKTQFFEYLQGEAEAGLERLHHWAEKEWMDHLGSRDKEWDDTEQGFLNFRSKVIGLTKVTGDYFDKLVRALENGLKDVTTTRMEGPRSNNHTHDSHVDVG